MTIGRSTRIAIAATRIMLHTLRTRSMDPHTATGWMVLDSRGSPTQLSSAENKCEYWFHVICFANNSHSSGCALHFNELQEVGWLANLSRIRWPIQQLHRQTHLQITMDCGCGEAVELLHYHCLESEREAVKDVGKAWGKQPDIPRYPDSNCWPTFNHRVEQQQLKKEKDWRLWQKRIRHWS